MTTREMTWFEIEDEFGPLLEIALASDGGWDLAAITTARDERRLWTRVEPGLVSTGFHYVNRETYFVSAKAHAADVEINEIDADIDDCYRCLSWTDRGRGSLCWACEGEGEEEV